MELIKTISAVVVLYDPEQIVFDNIKTYIDHIDRLYIIDNSTKEHSLLKKFSDFTNIDIVYSGDNIGVSKALNLALDKAYSDHCKWLMTLDQDTSFKHDDIHLFLQDFDTLENEKIALVSPLHNNKFTTIQKDNVFSNKEYVMTSANIVNVSIAREVGGYDEKLFIDEVDHEFCFRLKKHGYTILVHNAIAVNHSLGSKNKDHENITIYDSIRLYYMTRNYLYLKKKYYYQYQDFFKQRDGYMMKFFKNQLFYGENPLKNIRMIFRGILDYKRNQFGQFKNE